MGEFAASAALALLLAGGAAGQCDPHWDTTIGMPGLMPGRVHGLATFDDGFGPSLFAGVFGGGAGLRRWTGTEWTAVSGCPSDQVRALAVFDDGSGPALYVAGSFPSFGGISNTAYIARWNGVSWSAAGSGVNNEVQDLEVVDDGSGAGERLFVVGGFTLAGGSATDGIAAWDGKGWSTFGTCLVEPNIWDVAVFDSGKGPSLYVAGQFQTCAGSPMLHVARWTGTEWEPVGGGMNARVFSLTVFDDGGGPALFAGGEFTIAGSVQAARIAKWDGVEWAAVGFGFDSRLRDLAVFDDGVTGPSLYATGTLEQSGKMEIKGLARWTGTEWQSVAEGVYGADGGIKLLPMAGGKGTPASLVIGGEFTFAGGVPANYVARWSNPLSQITFRSQPAGGTIVVNSALTLSVTADGPQPLTYGWRRNGTPLIDGGHVSGATTPTLTVNPIAFSEAGSYDVMVSNPYCSYTSDAADIAVAYACTGDIDENSVVNIDDLLLVILLWGPCAGPPHICAYADIVPPGGDGAVNIDDLLKVINSWGECP